MITQPTPRGYDYCAHTLSARAIEHMCALDLVEAALDALYKTVEQLEDVEARCRAAATASRVAMHMMKCRDLTDNVPMELWHSKSLRRYVRSVEQLKTSIRRAWPGKDLNAVEFLAAIIAIVAHIDTQLPRTMAYMEARLEWGRLHSAMHDLYCMFDPDLEADAEMTRGFKIGDMMRKAVRQ